MSHPENQNPQSDIADSQFRKVDADADIHLSLTQNSANPLLNLSGSVLAMPSEQNPVPISPKTNDHLNRIRKYSRHKSSEERDRYFDEPN